VLRTCAGEMKLNREQTSTNRYVICVVRATTHFQDPAIVAEVSRNLGEPMVGINVSTLPEEEQMARRGW